MENVGDREKCKWIKLINFRSFIDSCYDFHKSSRIIIHGNASEKRTETKQVEVKLLRIFSLSLRFNKNT